MPSPFETEAVKFFRSFPSDAKIIETLTPLLGWTPPKQHANLMRKGKIPYTWVLAVARVMIPDPAARRIALTAELAHRLGVSESKLRQFVTLFGADREWAGVVAAKLTAHPKKDVDVAAALLAEVAS